MTDPRSALDLYPWLAAIVASAEEAVLSKSPDLGRLLATPGRAAEVVDTILAAFRDELGFRSAAAIGYERDGRGLAGSGRLRDAAERHRGGWERGETVEEVSAGSLLLCAPLPGGLGVLVATGRRGGLDDDDRAFLRSIATLIAASYAAGSELAA